MQHHFPGKNRMNHYSCKFLKIRVFNFIYYAYSAKIEFVSVTDFKILYRYIISWFRFGIRQTKSYESE